jgi:geranylgeranyl pyrophosphate synthase
MIFVGPTGGVSGVLWLGGPVGIESLAALIEKYNGFGRIQDRAQAFTDKARQLIGEFPESPYQRALYAVTELVTDRDH